MPERHFTPEEANELLAEVRPVAEELVARRRELAVTTARRARLVARIAGNGGDFDPQEPRALEEELEREAKPIVRCVERLEGLGVLVKEEVAHWHGLDEGFAGRKPL